jgi:hypothetical protein
VNDTKEPQKQGVLIDRWYEYKNDEIGTNGPMSRKKEMHAMFLRNKVHMRHI